MNKKIAPWAAALFCAVSIHILIFTLSDDVSWMGFDMPTTSSQANFELLLLPKDNSSNIEKNRTPTPQQETNTVNRTSDDIVADLPKDDIELNPTDLTEPIQLIDTDEIDVAGTHSLADDTLNIDNTLIEPKEENIDTSLASDLNKPLEAITSDLPPSAIDLSKPDLLDLSNVSLSPDFKDESLTKVFSEELRNKIADSKAAQQEYSKGLSADTDYPITTDADGTRYVNIKGVCWRLPPEGDTQGEGWAIVFDGCGIKNKLFHFELNIAPSIFTNELLGPESPFYMDQSSN
ncbi:hypothetical protein J9B83_13860 [Marinomonas sp. A79]|uniref:Secreted protein n=1 Tax=Marinomonas vulgaris TaxID=2823372 RepID=A0ABS5HEW9_9GAMM|nr:hypothetical protein [Marinomonas vulgaris]MBR7889999.1 hypothetical protein [Marinomonas vulgaris]